MSLSLLEYDNTPTPAIITISDDSDALLISSDGEDLEMDDEKQKNSLENLLLYRRFEQQPMPVLDDKVQEDESGSIHIPISKYGAVTMSVKELCSFNSLFCEDPPVTTLSCLTETMPIASKLLVETEMFRLTDRLESSSFDSLVDKLDNNFIVPEHFKSNLELYSSIFKVPYKQVGYYFDGSGKMCFIIDSEYIHYNYQGKWYSQINYHTRPEVLVEVAKDLNSANVIDEGSLMLPVNLYFVNPSMHYYRISNIDFQVFQTTYNINDIDLKKTLNGPRFPRCKRKLFWDTPTDLKTIKKKAKTPRRNASWRRSSRFITPSRRL